MPTVSSSTHSSMLRHVNCACSAAILERARLRAHFREVIAELAARDVSDLTPAQRRVRQRLLGELARYAHMGQFPKNRDFPERPTPAFIDAEGTRCAMAHLIESTGDRDIVARVARTQNHAFVHELASDLALRAWLAHAGLTAAEAARIQPSYCFLSKAEACLCENTYSVTGVIEATIIAPSGAGGVKVRVDVVHGDAGALTAGSELDVYSGGDLGSGLLIPVSTDQTDIPSYGRAYEVDADGNVVLACQISVPALGKTEAIDALMAAARATSDKPAACVESVVALDPVWEESQCDDGGCSAGAGGASPLAVGAAMLAATLWSRAGGRSA